MAGVAKDRWIDSIKEARDPFPNDLGWRAEWDLDKNGSGAGPGAEGRKRVVELTMAEGPASAGDARRDEWTGVSGRGRAVNDRCRGGGGA